MMLYIVRGLQGSGKSTAAAVLNANLHVEADQYFVRDGVYHWDPARISAAHEWCQQTVALGMAAALPKIAVANTFITRRTMEPYVALAAKHGYAWSVIDLFDGGLSDEELAARCVHNVPVETIRKNRARYEH